MEHTYDSLTQKTVAELREIAEGMDHDKVHGYKSVHKEDLVKLLCGALGIDAHEHHKVVGLDKAKIKAQIQALKEKRTAALEAHDPKQLKWTRLNIKRLKHKIRRATV
ncbi:MAG: hypothetical protein BMS9Abin37_2662 [Acidobacteriota bacterium]|nr:MAG: hypothetical protein BMS9Abin37_2662 [Acidobacteriota bacterium]